MAGCLFALLTKLVNLTGACRYDDSSPQAMKRDRPDVLAPSPGGHQCAGQFNGAVHSGSAHSSAEHSGHCSPQAVHNYGCRQHRSHEGAESPWAPQFTLPVDICAILQGLNLQIIERSLVCMQKLTRLFGCSLELRAYLYGHRSFDKVLPEFDAVESCSSRSCAFGCRRAVLWSLVSMLN